MNLKILARKFVEQVIIEVLPDKLVKDKLNELDIKGSVYVLSIGKAAWRMAKAASEVLNVKYGIVITKYNHSLGPIEHFEIFEAGHPIPDENSLKATKYAIEKLSGLSENDHLIFLVSGGGSALFEYPEDGINFEEIQDITRQLLKSGADIVEINTIRKRLSKVKGGKFAKIIFPARITALVLSDVLGDRLESIASGPAYPDIMTKEDAKKIIKKYNLKISEKVMKAIEKETPKQIENATHYIIGSVELACKTLEKFANKEGFNTYILTTQLNCEAKEAGRFVASIAKSIDQTSFITPACIIFGGETVVEVKGKGKGGRNQELSLSAAIEIEGMDNVVVASVGTDGTDGPTDAAGGIIDGETVKKIKKFGKDPYEFLENNDSYNALLLAGDLLKTGPTGTNINDFGFILIK
ncbi:glycerate kinase type-2 family protein [Thermosipho atlanticus]|uniref:Glycerate 2-kinase n=1 Tax=Thermosipho atlanticus DSM 15807 TaxID=1123380 RepID=A0A1M5S3G3_9BACT|nr:glycerate kinase [Thermosipho atlanticus]SHH33034.1 glycerate 2-kinase [Thermosipho atlanticus DSM 15807]